MLRLLDIYGAPKGPQKKKTPSPSSGQIWYYSQNLFSLFPTVFFSLGRARIITVGFRLYVKVLTGVCV
jgi:hypothetical protein